MSYSKVDNSSTKLKISDIALDNGIQPRQKLNQVVVSEYAEAMRQGVMFPPVIVFYDGNQFWLADGFHRVAAKQTNSDFEILAERKCGSRRDAILYAAGANAKYGLQRTNADKRRVVERLLQDSEWSRWSNCEIARRCGVNEKTVRNTRKQLDLEKSLKPTNAKDLESSSICFVRRNNKTFSMNVTNIGKKTTRNKRNSSCNKIAQ